MKIAFLNPTAEVGGAERSLLDVCASIRAARPDHSLELVVPRDGPLVEQAGALGVPSRVVPFPAALARLGDSASSRGTQRPLGPLAPFVALAAAAPAAAGYVSALRSTLLDARPDVIHTNGFKMHVLGAWARPRRAALVWHVHDFVSSRPLMSRLLRLHASRCESVVANSNSVAADVRALLDAALPVTTVYNAVDLARFNPCGAALDLDALAGMPAADPRTVRVGLVATMGHWKGHEVFLRAIAALPSALPPVRAYVVSGPVYETASPQFTIEGLKALASALGIADRVAFTGFQRDSAAAMRALDVVVHASTEPEPFGLVVVEAMACARAVVVSAAGGAAELIEPGVDALAHEPGDVAMLATRIAALVADPALRGRLGAAGRKTAERTFDRARLASQLLPIYEQAIAARSTRLA